jgi:hypothetical protein
MEQIRAQYNKKNATILYDGIGSSIIDGPNFAIDIIR